MACAVEAAAKEIRHGPFVDRIEQETVGDPEDEPCEQRGSDISALPRGAPQQDRKAELRLGYSGPNSSLRSSALLIIRRHRGLQFAPFDRRTEKAVPHLRHAKGLEGRCRRRYL
jgi:hypothetical protein